MARQAPQVRQELPAPSVRRALRAQPERLVRRALRAQPDRQALQALQAQLAPLAQDRVRRAAAHTLLP